MTLFPVCECCGHVLVWSGPTTQTCPAVACPNPTTLELGADSPQLELIDDGREGRGDA